MSKFPRPDQGGEIAERHSSLAELLRTWNQFQDLRAAAAPLSDLGEALDRLHAARMNAQRTWRW
jgi:hypothetical protein